MSLTEAEARKRWCPFAQIVDARDHVGNRDGSLRGMGKPEDGTFCLASGCMAWRWGRPVLGIEAGLLRTCGSAIMNMQEDVKIELDQAAFRVALDAVQCAFEAGGEHEEQCAAAIKAYLGAWVAKPAPEASLEAHAKRLERLDASVAALAGLEVEIGNFASHHELRIAELAECLDALEKRFSGAWVEEDPGDHHPLAPTVRAMTASLKEGAIRQQMIEVLRKELHRQYEQYGIGFTQWRNEDETPAPFVFL